MGITAERKAAGQRYHGTYHGYHDRGPITHTPLLEGGGVRSDDSQAVENKESDPSTCLCGKPISELRLAYGKTMCADCEAAA